MFEARATRKAAVAANKLSVEQLEAIIKAKRANEPGVFDATITALDEGQAYVRGALAEGLGWLASAIRPGN